MGARKIRPLRAAEIIVYKWRYSQCKIALNVDDGGPGDGQASSLMGRLVRQRQEHGGIPATAQKQNPDES